MMTSGKNEADICGAPGVGTDDGICAGGELAAVGAELLARARAQLADEAYGETFLSDGDALALRAQWAASMEDDGVRPAIYPRARLSSLYEMALASDGGAPDLDGEVMDVLEEAAVSMLASILLGNMGVKYITAAATFNLQDFYALPDGFSDCVLVYGFSDVSLLIECTREEAGEGGVSLRPRIPERAGGRQYARGHGGPGRSRRHRGIAQRHGATKQGQSNDAFSRAAIGATLTPACRRMRAQVEWLSKPRAGGCGRASRNNG